MAKYQVEHSCGCVKTYQLYGPTKERESRIAWLETQKCPDCKRERENAENSKKAEAAGRPELTGSEKQVAWANTIRENAVESITSECTTTRMRRLSSVLTIAATGTDKRHAVDAVACQIGNRLRAEGKGDEYVKTRKHEIADMLGDNPDARMKNIVDRLLAAVDTVTTAREWIDNRDDAVLMLADIVAVDLIGTDIDKAPKTLHAEQFGRCKNGSYFLKTHGFCEATDQDIRAELAFVDADDVTDNGDGTITIDNDVIESAIRKAERRTTANYGTFCNVYLNQPKK